MHAQHKGVLVPLGQKKSRRPVVATLKSNSFPAAPWENPGQAYAMVEKNIADIGWDIADYSPGRFPADHGH